MRMLILLLVALIAGCGSGTSEASTADAPSKGKQRARVVRRTRPAPAPAPAPAITPAILVGQWAGPHVHMDFDGNVARLEFDCADATFQLPVTMDASGAFEADGTFKQGHGGPTRSDEDQHGRPAHFSGKVDGDALSLRITATDGTQVLGEFSLKRGGASRLYRCY
jgi:hypothetical protein